MTKMKLKFSKPIKDKLLNKLCNFNYSCKTISDDKDITDYIMDNYFSQMIEGKLYTFDIYFPDSEKNEVLAVANLLPNIKISNNTCEVISDLLDEIVKTTTISDKTQAYLEEEFKNSNFEIKFLVRNKFANNKFAMNIFNFCEKNHVVKTPTV